MIRAVIAMNDQGKPRLVKFYDYQPVEKQQELIRSIYGVLCSRAENVSNFIQADPIFGPDAQLVYKTYDTLYFVFIFDSAENELAMLDLMQGWKRPQIQFWLSQNLFLAGMLDST
ncbi:hypothetical protein CsSME_00009396 [Camellia sinensis var. sinensis]